MKKDIHPTCYKNSTITCSCGNVFKIGSTKKETKIEICANCHPFFTGKEKLIDIAGRVDKFKQRMAKAQSLKSNTKEKKKRAKATKKDILTKTN